MRGSTEKNTTRMKYTTDKEGEKADRKTSKTDEDERNRRKRVQREVVKEEKHDRTERENQQQGFNTTRETYGAPRVHTNSKVHPAKPSRHTHWLHVYTQTRKRIPQNRTAKLLASRIRGQSRFEKTPPVPVAQSAHTKLFVGQAEVDDAILTRVVKKVAKGTSDERLVSWLNVENGKKNGVQLSPEMSNHS